MTNEEYIIARFRDVKNMNWIKSSRRNNTGVRIRECNLSKLYSKVNELIRIFV